MVGTFGKSGQRVAVEMANVRIARALQLRDEHGFLELRNTA
jgi:hypothetical protein